MKLSWVHSTSRPVEPSRLEFPRATWAKPVRRGITRWSVRVWFDPSGFIKSDPWCQFLLGPPQCLCPALSTEVDLSPSRECDTSHHHPLPAARPGGQNHRGQWVIIRGQWPNPIQRGRSKDGITWELLRGLGYSGSSLPSWLGLSPANLLYREDFPQSIHLG